ncbi:unnamed protein product [Dovyalis caffra]|uniref:Uncharacterized protein n=1 Tax=Dovyalis caffra TaxID=77055 RepID=A0AAV1R153_9ROSI|nr:unnamed protein product [Dovyalis caffra]
MAHCARPSREDGPTHGTAACQLKSFKIEEFDRRRPFDQCLRSCVTAARRLAVEIGGKLSSALALVSGQHQRDKYN